MQEVQEVIKSAGDAGIAKMCRCCWCCYAITKKGRISATSHHPNSSSGHHKHDSNNREQSNHAYYQIFSHHPNTSSGHLPATHASCTSAACCRSPYRTLAPDSFLPSRSGPKGHSSCCQRLPTACPSSSAGA